MYSKLYKILMLTAIVVLVSSCAGESDETGSGSGSLGDSSPTNVPHQTGLFIAYGSEASSIYESNDTLSSTVTQVEVTVYADDINNLLVSGATVNFRTEWGTFLDGYDSCVLSEGSCTVIWQSGGASYTPSDCQIVFTAWTSGDETFVDANDNGYYDLGETFLDAVEPYLDIDFNARYDAGVFSNEGVPELIDINDFTGAGAGSNGLHDTGNGLYDGSFCKGGCGNPSTIISHNSAVTIQEPFIDENDIDQDTDITESINYCNYIIP